MLKIKFGKLLSISLLVPLFSLLVISQVSLSQNQEEKYSAIIFYATNSGSTFDIFLINPDGSRQINLTPTSLVDEVTPAWSPDGQQIAFGKQTKPDTESFDIYTMDINGVIINQLTDVSGNDYFPAWSPNGQQIVFTSGRDGNQEIYIMNSDGTGQANLTKTDAMEYGPVWSPDGNYIFFNSNRDGNWETYRMESDGSNPTNITNNPGRELNLAWAPLGSSHVYTGAYTHDYDNAQGGLHAELYLLKNDWTDDEWSDPVFIDDASYVYEEITWSPDGQEMAFVIGDDGGRIHILNMENFSRRFIQNRGKTSAFGLAWSPFLATNPNIPIATPTLPRPDPFQPPAPECPNAPPSRLGGNMIAGVVLPEPGEIRQNLRVRATPGGEQVGSLEAGQEFRITGQGVCGDDGLLWWPIKALDSDLEGWSAEGFAPDDYLMVPLRTG